MEEGEYATPGNWPLLTDAALERHRRMTTGGKVV